jgi:hypothetical protein
MRWIAAWAAFSPRMRPSSRAAASNRPNAGRDERAWIVTRPYSSAPGSDTSWPSIASTPTSPTPARAGSSPARAETRSFAFSPGR